MKVIIVSHTSNPEITCATAAWLCTHSEPKTDFTYSEACALVQRVIGYGHESIAEHASFTVLVEGISRALSHQLVRHRIASYSQQSQRYVNFDSGFSGFIDMPESFKRTEKLTDQWYKVMVNAEHEYKIAIEDGVPPEDARFLLPNAAETKIVMTMNTRAWREFLAKRLCKKAQWEIRAMAEEIHKQLVSKSPALFKGVGPDCKNCKEKEPCR